MRVLFLMATFNSKAKYHPGIASLSAVLKRDGHDTSFLSVNTMDYDYISDFIETYRPDVIAISTNSHQYHYVKKITPFICEKFNNIKVIAGGVHPTLNENVMNELSGLDAVCRGEGEIPLLQYINSLKAGEEPRDIPNMTLRTEQGINNNVVTYYVEDLDSLPYPDYSIFPNFKKPGKINFPMRFFFNRGCPFNCTYCCNHKLKELFPEKERYVRYKSPKRVVDELLYFSDLYDFDHYVVDDDIFTLNKKWLLEFCSLYPDKMKQKTFEVNVRVGTADRQMLKAIKNIGCTLIKIGIESGSENLRQRILGRFIAQDKIVETAQMVKSLGLRLHTFNMIGSPNETRRDVWKTITLNRRIGPDKTQLTVFYPYKNTILGDCCIDKGLVDKNRADSYFTESILKVNPWRLSRIEISHYVKMFNFYIYIGRDNKIAFLLLSKMIKDCFKRLKSAAVSYIEQNVVKYYNKIDKNIFTKIKYKISKTFYLHKKSMKESPMWEDDIIRDSYLNELKPVFDNRRYTQHGILNTEALFLYSLLRKEAPDVVIESGTYKGYSSLFIAEALKRNGKGRLITISVNRDNCLAFARKRLLDYPFVEIIEGESQKILKDKFKPLRVKDKISVFIDGPKGSSRDFDELLFLLKAKIDEGYNIDSILIHDCEKHIPMFYNKNILEGYLNPTRLKTEYFYKKFFSINRTLNFMTNNYYENYKFLDKDIFSKPDTDILPYNFKKGRQVSYGTSIAVIKVK